MAERATWLGPKDGCTCSRRARKWHDSACPCYGRTGSEPEQSQAEDFLSSVQPRPRSRTTAAYDTECICVPDHEDMCGGLREDCPVHGPEEPLSAADDFLMAEPPEPERKKTDRNGYRVKDPRTGDFRRWKKGTIRSFTRATTFIKVASDRTQLQTWNERNVLIGAARNPDVAARALTWNAETTEGKRELDAIVEELSEKAGSKDAANKGTAIHASVEKWIAGTPPHELPAEHKPYLRAFANALSAHELRIVPGMVERTVFYPLPDDAGIVGTLDYIVEHTPTGRYYIGDLKTGARMDYAWQEYEAQTAIYRDGYATFGVYLWGTFEEADKWVEPRLELDEREALVFHLPAKHEGKEPYCDVLRANLDEGREHLKMCYDVRTQIAKRPKPTRWETPQFKPEPERWRKGGDGLWSRADAPAAEPEDRDWEAEFGQASSKLHMAGLYESARSVIDDEVRLRSLIDIGMARLAEMENEPPF